MFDVDSSVYPCIRVVGNISYSSSDKSSDHVYGDDCLNAAIFIEVQEEMWDQLDIARIRCFLMKRLLFCFNDIRNIVVPKATTRNSGSGKVTRIREL